MNIIYDIVVSGSIRDLINQVNKKLKAGWKPIGGICYADGGHYQAIVHSY